MEDYKDEDEDETCENKISKIEIPPGYTPLENIKKKTPIETWPERRYIREDINTGELYLFDPENKEYADFLKQCKEDTKSLEQALRKKIKDEELPVWTNNSRRYGKAKIENFEKIRFIIRPPFFKAHFAKKNKETRMQRSESTDIIILHYDRNHILQTTRSWLSWLSPNKNNLRLKIGNLIKSEKYYYELNYGNWEVMAEGISNILWSLQQEINDARAIKPPIENPQQIIDILANTYSIDHEDTRLIIEPYLQSGALSEYGLKCIKNSLEEKGIELYNSGIESQISENPSQIMEEFIEKIKYNEDISINKKLPQKIIREIVNILKQEYPLNIGEAKIIADFILKNPIPIEDTIDAIDLIVKAIESYFGLTYEDIEHNKDAIISQYIDKISYKDRKKYDTFKIPKIKKAFKEQISKYLPFLK